MNLVVVELARYPWYVLTDGPCTRRFEDADGGNEDQTGEGASKGCRGTGRVCASLAQGREAEGERDLLQRQRQRKEEKKNMKVRRDSEAKEFSRVRR